MIKTIVSKIDIKQDQGTKIKKVLGSPKKCDSVSFTCLHCNDKFNDENDLKQHMLQVHIVKKVQPTKEVKEEGHCKLCNQDFFTETAMKLHETRPSKCLQHHQQCWCKILWTGVNLLL